MGRLVTFGCSYTHGQGIELPDPITKASPQGKTWGAVLSKKLKLLHLNLAAPGSSNRRICHTVLRADLRPDDTVVILWTHFERTCLFTMADDVKKKTNFMDKTWHKNLTSTNIGPWTNSPVSKCWIKHFSGFYDGLVDVNLFISYISYYLDSKGIKNYHALALDRFRGETFSKDDAIFIKTDFSNNAKIFNTNFQACEIDKGADKSHPGKRSHKKFAQLIYKEMEAMNED